MSSLPAYVPAAISCIAVTTEINTLTRNNGNINWNKNETKANMRKNMRLFEKCHLNFVFAKVHIINAPRYRP